MRGVGSRAGPTSFKWNNKSSAARLCAHAEMAGGWEGQRSVLGVRVQMGGVGSGPGLQTDS